MIREQLRRGSVFIRSLVKEVGATLVAANLYPLGLFENDIEARKHSKLAKNPRPILLVHGIIHNRSAFFSLKRRMQRLGWENIFTINYNTFHGNVLQMVEELSHKIDRVMART